VFAHTLHHCHGFELLEQIATGFLRGHVNYTDFCDYICQSFAEVDGKIRSYQYGSLDDVTQHCIFTTIRFVVVYATSGRKSRKRFFYTDHQLDIISARLSPTVRSGL